jgi:hypothetical protein
LASESDELRKRGVDLDENTLGIDDGESVRHGGCHLAPEMWTLQSFAPRLQVSDPPPASRKAFALSFGVRPCRH